MTTGNEALDVLRQACTMGRTDIVKHAINELTSLLKEKGMKNPDLDLRALISSSFPSFFQKSTPSPVFFVGL